VEKNMMTLTQLETEIFALPIHERTSLVQRLLLSLEEISESEFETLWANESAQRATRFDAGQTQAISGAEVAKKARTLLQ
jgi:putative addiction module component (TIGR02574 family)